MKKIFYAVGFLLTTIVMFSACKQDKSFLPDPTLPPVVDTGFVKGADISWITEMEAAGKKFYTATGAETACFALMKSLGINTVRFRVWVNPAASWNSAADVVMKAVRAENAGLRVLIDFHYSDTWADPGNQAKPAAWSSLSFEDLKNALAAHTGDVLKQLKSAGVSPEWVQVGNETNDGLLWPDGKASTNMSKYAQLINTGYDAVKAVFPAAKIIVHLSNGWDNNLFHWNIGGLITNGARFDVIGMSLYPSYFAGGWASANQQCLANMNDMVATYHKEVMIVEVGMPWDSPDQTRLFFTDLIAKTKSVTGSEGLGVLYWEPEAYNNWKGYTLGAFDNSGKPTVAMDPFKH